MKLTSLLFISLFALNCFSLPALADTKLSKAAKQQCKDIKNQLKESDKQTAALKAEIERLNLQFEEAKGRFASYRGKLSGMSGCSQGNPGNNSECLQTLAGLKQSGDDMNRIDQQRLVPTRKKNTIENEMLTPKAMQKALNCPQ